VKLVFRLSLSVAALILACGSLRPASAQADPFVAQLTQTPLATQTFVNDISGNGRFVVIESTADIGTKDASLGLNPDNSDLNREIFLIDYAQRIIFQLTNTKRRLNDTAMSSTLIPNIRIEISNNRPVISNMASADGFYWIAFSSNANSLSPSGTNTSTPANFDGNNLSDADRDALLADANQEIWVYRFAAPPDVNLSDGVVPPFVNLTNGTFTRVTNTPASQLPQGGIIVNNQSISPVVADDNRDISINDDGSMLAFVSTRSLVAATNADGNAEIFVGVRPFAATAFSVAQTTTTQDISVTQPIFNSTPSISGSGARVAYASNANIPDTGMPTGNNADRNAELYYANLDTATGAVLANKQVTRTTRVNPTDIINVLNSGRRISRDGSLIAFESTADLSNTTPGANATSTTVFLYNVTANTFTKVGARGAEDTTIGGDVLRFPIFSDYVGQTPGSLVFASRLNFKADGTIPATASEGLNSDPGRPVQTYVAPLPIGATPTFTRLTKNPPVALFLASLQPFASNTRERIAFTLASTELGGGNSDGSTEVFYLLTLKNVISDRNVTESYATGASNRTVGPTPSPTPTPSPSPSPTPTPVTPETVAGVSPGMVAIVRFQNRLVFAPQSATNASLTRSPSLPIELSGVSMSVNNAAVGLYSVSRNQIVFVVPQGLASGATSISYPVVINVKGQILRGTIMVSAAQPDIFTSTDGPGGRARVFNAFNMTTEPFTVFTVRPRQPRAPTVLRIILTGVRGVLASQITVRIGTTTLTGTTAIRSAAVETDMPGFYRIDVQLPPELAGAGDVPIVVSVSGSGLTFTSRLEDTAPHILIL
jgi:uncharacterized protein (TIGR03437 family)